VSIDGQPWADAEVQLYEVRVGPALQRRLSHRTSHRCDGGGRFAAERLPPGEYALRIEREDARTSYRLGFGEHLVLPPSGDVDRAFDFRAHPVRLRLLDAGGRPLAQHEVLILSPDNPDSSAGGITGDDGWIEWPALPPGRLTLRVFPTTRRMAFDQKALRTEEEWQAMAVELEALVVVSGRGAQVFERRLPAR
jgi:hypothetical protein